MEEIDRNIVPHLLGYLESHLYLLYVYFYFRVSALFSTGIPIESLLQPKAKSKAEPKAKAELKGEPKSKAKAKRPQPSHADPRRSAVADKTATFWEGVKLPKK